jgi:hypothetical protein
MMMGKHYVDVFAMLIAIFLLGKIILCTEFTKNRRRKRLDNVLFVDNTDENSGEKE